MKFGAVLGLTLIVALMALIELPRMHPKKQKKEKAVFVTLAATGWLLAILLLFFPDMPGPTQLVHTMYKPFERIMEKK